MTSYAERSSPPPASPSHWHPKTVAMFGMGHVAVAFQSPEGHSICSSALASSLKAASAGRLRDALVGHPPSSPLSARASYLLVGRQPH
mmetsp:Transcript_14041/g.39763  ORF Transcript_14041/g.39763 Transcript_14041/m.39763 type:complete len:88 (+) Transcript_14041:3619-3882(+)